MQETHGERDIRRPAGRQKPRQFYRVAFGDLRRHYGCSDYSASGDPTEAPWPSDQSPQTVPRLWVSDHPGIAGQPQITTEERLPHIGTICGKDRFTQPETLLDNTSPGQLSRTYSAGLISSRIIGIPFLTPHTQGVLGRSADLASTAVLFGIGHMKA
jgi:hypothetical protein